MSGRFLFNRGRKISSGADYVISDYIGRNSYSETYLIERIPDEAVFSLKVYIPDRMPEVLKFSGEPRLLTYLNAGDVAFGLSVVSWGELKSADGRHLPYIISDYFEFGTIRECLEDGAQFEAEAALKYCLDLADRLISLQGPAGETFLHLGISPDSLLMGTDRNDDPTAYLSLSDTLVHVSDNGRAAMEPSLEQLDLRYAAPEILNGNGAVFNSDVYSLGVLLFELYCGEYPWILEEYDKAKGMQQKVQALDRIRTQVPDVYREDDGREMIVFCLFMFFTMYDKEQELQNMRPDLHGARIMLRVAYDSLMADRGKGLKLKAFYHRLAGINPDIFDEEEPVGTFGNLRDFLEAAELGFEQADKKILN